MSEATRYCPLCDRTMAAMQCPEHAVPTVSVAAVERSTRDDTPGRTLGGRYRVEALLGEGAMGRVYAATQLSVDRPVAIKTLHPRHAGEKRALQRFYQEARAASRLESPHAVSVYDFGLDDDSGLAWIAMERIEGHSLAALLEGEAPLTPERSAALLAQAAAAIVEAHAAGVVHRDLKPGNILISQRDGREHVTVVDFGVARLLEEDPALRLTETGVLLGTPHYMAPEQLSGAGVGPAADVYALGCILHELLTGAPPHGGSDLRRLTAQRLYEGPPTLPSALPASIAQLHDAALREEASARPDMETLRRGLEAAADGEALPETLLAIPAPPPPPVLTSRAGERTLAEAPAGRGKHVIWIVAALLALAVVLWWARRPAPQPAPPPPAVEAPDPTPAPRATAPKSSSPEPSPPAPPAPKRRPPKLRPPAKAPALPAPVPWEPIDE